MDKNELTTPDSGQVERMDSVTLEQLLLSTNNSEALESVGKELDDLDMIAGKLKRHTLRLLDAMEGDDEEDGRPRRMNSKSKPRVSHVYVASQVANLISMKNLKMSMLKHKQDLSNTRIEKAFKILNQLKKEGSGGEGISHADVMAVLRSSGVTIPVSPDDPDYLVLDESVNEEDIDAALEAAIAENGVEGIFLDKNGSPISEAEYKQLQEAAMEAEENGEDEIGEDEPVPTSIFMDADTGEIYLLDKDDEIIKTLGEHEVDIEEVSEDVYHCNKYDLPFYTS